MAKLNKAPSRTCISSCSLLDAFRSVDAFFCVETSRDAFSVNDSSSSDSSLMTPCSKDSFDKEVLDDLTDEVEVFADDLVLEPEHPEHVLDVDEELEVVEAVDSFCFLLNFCHGGQFFNVFIMAVRK